LENFYQTTRRYNPEDSHIRTHRRKNLKSYWIINYKWYKLNIKIKIAILKKRSSVYKKQVYKEM
jgi:hypothetical protein